MALLEWLESTSYAQWILVSAVGWPLMLSLHAFGLAIVVGTVFSLNLRMLGLFRTMPFSAVHDLMGIAWIGIWLNIFTGVSIFFTQASTYVTSAPFLVKIFFIILGIANVWYTRKTLAAEAARWDEAGTAPPISSWLAISSLVFWAIALVTGRLIAYL